MLRLLAKTPIRSISKKTAYNKTQCETLSNLLIKDPLRIVDKGHVLAKGNPLIAQLRKDYPDLYTEESRKLKPVITNFDRLKQQSYEKLQGLTCAYSRGWKKELILEQQEKLYKYPIDSSNYTYWDEKIHEKEKNVPHYEHSDFVNRYLSPLKNTGQLYYFLEAIGQGLMKNPYLSLDDKLDEIARYVQYFIFKKDFILSINLMTEKNFILYENSQFSLKNRKIKFDHWTKENWNPRHLRRDDKLYKYKLHEPRAEYFYLLLNAKTRAKKRADLVKIREFFGKNHKLIIGKSKSQFLVRIHNYAENDQIKEFDFDSIQYEQINFNKSYYQLPDEHERSAKSLEKFTAHRIKRGHKKPELWEIKRRQAIFRQKHFLTRFKRKRLNKRGKLVS